MGRKEGDLLQTSLFRGDIPPSLPSAIRRTSRGRERIGRAARGTPPPLAARRSGRARASSVGSTARGGAAPGRERAIVLRRNGESASAVAARSACLPPSFLPQPSIRADAAAAMAPSLKTPTSFGFHIRRRRRRCPSVRPSVSLSGEAIEVTNLALSGSVLPELRAGTPSLPPSHNPHILARPQHMRVWEDHCRRRRC